MKKVLVTAIALFLIVRMYVPVFECNGEIRANTCFTIDGEVYSLENSFIDVDEMPIEIYLEKIDTIKYKVVEVKIDWDTFQEDGHNYQY